MKPSTLAPKQSMAEITQLTSHPAFPRYSQQIKAFTDAPPTLLRHLLRAMTDAEWPSTKQGLVQICDNFPEPTTRSANPLQVTHTIERPSNTTADAVIFEGTNNNVQYLKPSSSLARSSPQTANSDCNMSAQTSIDNTQQILQGRWYVCDWRHCKGKQYKRLGAFQNHMTLHHYLSEFDPSQYQFNLDDPFDRQRLKARATHIQQSLAEAQQKTDHKVQGQRPTKTDSTEEPRPSISSDSTTWSATTLATSAFSQPYLSPSRSFKATNSNDEGVIPGVMKPPNFSMPMHQWQSHVLDPANMEHDGPFHQPRISSRMSWLPTTMPPATGSFYPIGSGTGIQLPGEEPSSFFLD